MPTDAPKGWETTPGPITFNPCKYAIATPYSAFETYECIALDEPVLETPTTWQYVLYTEYGDELFVAAEASVRAIETRFENDKCCSRSKSIFLGASVTTLKTLGPESPMPQQLSERRCDARSKEGIRPSDVHREIKVAQPDGCQLELVGVHGKCTNRPNVSIENEKR